ncbi:gliding motility-associated C-terminal domain-containing protein [Hymenobacter monticola]|uniref:Gliding motility-associated C-terminal domain-containing protein n=1 Tax=Hymenobacter monticola TaxID=1705399 RepID=A0ABY4BD89_9BACT|nr:gliding motility-associated C-terminal domain-containing protein [Hymenobacter monticola]UOE35981.1 gliding motility-associated C-terminal domain-containing protein [Hymenobacter monticola]
MTRLLRKTRILLLCWLGVVWSAAANHLMGGELTYRYLDAAGTRDAPFRYRFTASIYYDNINLPGGDPYVPITIFSKAPGRPMLSRLVVTRTSLEALSQSATGCTPQSPGVTLGQYVVTVALPAVAEGYEAVLVVNNRSTMLTNLRAPDLQSMSVAVDVAPPSLPNSSPVFSDRAAIEICLGDTSTVLNNAYDADGDRLSYRFGTPTAPVNNMAASPVVYAPGYSAAAPFGAAGYVGIDARTGLARYYGRTQGAFLLAVDVSEYRIVNGREILLGTMRRDIQVFVRVCGGPVNQPPVFTVAPAQRNFQVVPGQVLNVDITATDPEGQPLDMTVSSVLLDGPGAIAATVNGQPGNGSSTNPVGRVQVAGTATVTGRFQFAATCAQARPEPYDVIVTASDEPCSRKTIATAFQITVVAPPAGLVRIVGDSTVCAESTRSYTAVGTAFGSYQWTAEGGQIQGPATGRTVLVQWAGSSGAVSVRGATGTGCFSAPAYLPVAVVTGPVVTGPAVYCRAASTGLRYQVNGPAARYQWSISGGTVVSGQGTNEVVVDVAPGAAATLRVVDPSFPTCPGTTFPIGLDDTCLAFFNIITPNGDGQNDKFIIENVERHPNTRLSIYNRWGRQVYYSADYHNTYGGESTGAGMYYYHCQLADGTTYKGWFEIVQ